MIRKVLLALSVATALAGVVVLATGLARDTHAAPQTCEELRPRIERKYPPTTPVPGIITPEEAISIAKRESEVDEIECVVLGGGLGGQGIYVVVIAFANEIPISGGPCRPRPCENKVFVAKVPWGVTIDPLTGEVLTSESL